MYFLINIFVIIIIIAVVVAVSDFKFCLSQFTRNLVHSHWSTLSDELNPFTLHVINNQLR